MSKIIFYLIIGLLPIIVLGQHPRAYVEVMQHAAEFDDFADVEAYFSGVFYNYNDEASFYYDVKQRVSGGNFVLRTNRVFWKDPGPNSFTLYFSDEPIPDIAQFAVIKRGTFLITAYAQADDYVSNYIGVHTFFVLDLKPPIIPLNFTASWSEDHPNMSWTNNSEVDLELYKIYKKSGSTWEYLTSTTDADYTDLTETRYTWPGTGTKKYVKYKIQAVDYTDNASEYSNILSFVVKDIDQQQKNLFSKAEDNTYSKAYPNPFNPTTKISFNLKRENFVNLNVYDLSGRKVATLINENKTVGPHSVGFDGSNLPSGIYIYTIKVGSFAETKRMLLIK